MDYVKTIEKIIISRELYGGNAKTSEDDDFVDRLNSRVTIGILIMCIFIVTATMYVGNPINCWTPAEFKDQHDGYANSICWLRGSYYLPTDEITIPDRSQPRTYFVSYYQWTPFILVGMTLLFFFPKVIWEAYVRHGGINIRRLIHTIKENTDAHKGADLVKDELKRYFDRQNQLQGTPCCGIRFPNLYIGFTSMYFTIKLLYLINALGQFFLLNTFLSFKFSGYGFEALKKLFSGGEVIQSPRFPLVTMCDFMVRRLGSNQHWYAIQCTLPINLYNEKIFLGVWIWLLILAVLNVLSILSWIVALTHRRRLAAIKKYLKVAGELPTKRNRVLSKTTADNTAENLKRLTDYLHADGFLIYRMFAQNTNEVVAGQLIQHLYTHCTSPKRHYDSNTV